MLTIRRAFLDDIKSITDIYNEAVITTVASFDTKPKTETDRRDWFTKHGQKRPIFVAELDNRIVGWASLSDWSSHDAYITTAELSIYIKNGFRHRGIGKILLSALLDEGEKVGLRTVIARITKGNDESIHFHKSLGFKRIGLMRNVGQKFGRYLDVQLMQLIYSDKPQ